MLFGRRDLKDVYVKHIFNFMKMVKATKSSFARDMLIQDLDLYMKYVQCVGVSPNYKGYFIDALADQVVSATMATKSFDISMKLIIDKAIHEENIEQFWVPGKERGFLGRIGFIFYRYAKIFGLLVFCFCSEISKALMGKRS